MGGNEVAMLLKETESGLPSLTVTEQSEFAVKKLSLMVKVIFGNCSETFLL